MKNPMHKLRRFFVRTRTYKATAAQAAAPTAHDDDEGSNRLSGAFLVVLFLHIIAVVGVFAFARIKEGRIRNMPPEKPAAPTAKAAPVKPAATKAPVVAPAAAAAIAATTPQPAPREVAKVSPNSSHTIHIVKEGETLTKIAFAYSTGVPDLVSTNKLKSPGDIHAGQALTIPGAKQTPKIAATPEVKPAQISAQKNTAMPAKIYVVRKGDTALKIAREHGCSYDELMKLNNVKDPKKIQLGQELKLPVKKG